MKNMLWIFVFIILNTFTVYANGSDHSFNKHLETGDLNDVFQTLIDKAVEKRFNDYIERQAADIVDKRINELVEKQLVQLEDRINDLVEKRVDEIVQQRVNDVVLKQLSTLFDEKLNTSAGRTLEGMFQNSVKGEPARTVQSGIASSPVVKRAHKRHSRSKRFVLDGEQYPGGIGFTACVSVPDLENLGEHHTILFDRVITNTGTAYHSNTGVFQAPMRGLYVFHLTSMSQPHKSQYLQFIKDGVYINSAYPDSADSADYGISGNLWVMDLDAGSEVWIQTQGPGQIHGNCFTVFSGFLLYEIE